MSEEKKQKLSNKQQIFINEYMIDFNATRAYKAAGFKYTTENSAGVMAHKLLKKPNIKEQVDARIKEREKRLEVTQDKVVNELARIAFADLRDFLEYRTEKTVIGKDRDTGEPIVDYQQIIDVIDSRKVDTKVVQEVSIGKDGTFKFKLYDKQKALSDLGRHLGMFVDKVEHSGGVNVTNPFEGLTTEELKKLIEEDEE